MSSARCRTEVVRRRREFAIRLALGTTRGGIVRHVCAQGRRPVAAGLAAGLVQVLAAARFIDAVLFEVAPLDPVVLGGAALVIVEISMVLANIASPCDDLNDHVATERLERKRETRGEIIIGTIV